MLPLPYKTTAPAKINLGLAVGKKLPNNYHEVKTIYTQIDFFDELMFEASQGNTTLSTNHKTLPTDNNNIILQAVARLEKAYLAMFFANPQPLKIFLKKNIPVGSGMGGGSSDAAQTLLALNKIWSLNLSHIELLKISTELGADVPYQLEGGVKFETQGTQAGVFTPLSSLPPLNILICFPDVQKSSFAVFEELDRYRLNQPISDNDLTKLINSINAKSPKLIGQHLHNDFERVLFNSHPELAKIKETMLANNAVGSTVSGTGSTIYGLYTSLQEAKKARSKLITQYPQTVITRPYEKKKRN